MIDRKSFLHDVFGNDEDVDDEDGVGHDVCNEDDDACDAGAEDADGDFVCEDDDDDGDVVCDDGPSSSIKVDKVIAGLDQSPPVLNNDTHRKTSCRIQEMLF